MWASGMRQGSGIVMPDQPDDKGKWHESLNKSEIRRSNYYVRDNAVSLLINIMFAIIHPVKP